MTPEEGYIEAERRIDALEEESTELDLSLLSLENIPTSLWKKTNLTKLDLRNNQLTQIPEQINELKNLTYLYLSSNQLTQIPEQIKELKKLKLLFLSSNQLNDDVLPLVEILVKNKLDLVSLTGNKISSVSREVLETNSAKQIVSHWREKTAEPLAKIVVLGESTAGKSWLSERYFLEREPEKNESTHDFELIVPKKKPKIRGKSIELRVWDFGGQHYLHGTHEMFLTERSVCLLVLNAKWSLEKNKRDALYWLKMIRFFLGPEAAIVIVMSQCDLGDCKITEKDVEGLQLEAKLTRKPHLVPLFRSKEESQKECSDLKEKIELALESIKGIEHGFTKESKAIKNKVQQEIIESGRSIVPISEYRTWCKELKITSSEDQDVFLRILHNFGIVFYFGVFNYEKEQLQSKEEHEENQRNHNLPPDGWKRMLRRQRDSVLEEFIINPQWLKWPIYEVIIQAALQSPLVDKKAIERAYFKACKDRNLEEHPSGSKVIEAILKLNQLSLFVEKEQKYLLPRGLPQDGRPLLQVCNLTPFKEWQWNFFPEATLHRFIIDCYENKEIAGANNIEFIWRYGVLLEFDDSGLIAVESDPANGKVTISIPLDDSSKPTKSQESRVERFFTI